MTAVGIDASVRIGLESAANLRYPDLLRRSPRDVDLLAELEVVENLGPAVITLRRLLPGERLDPEAAARLRRLEVFVSRMRAWPGTSPAALRVLVAVQEVLRPLEGQRLYGSHRTSAQPPLRGSLWRQLSRAQALAVAALSIDGTPAAAKRSQLDATPQPLAICGECGLVVPDATSSRGPSPFRSTCDRCRPKSLARRTADGERRRRAWERGLEEITPGVWL